MNPYALLQIKQTATDSEIREALKRQINIYCGKDENRKDGDGEYLKDLFIVAARQLLDPEKRKIVNASLAKDREKYAIKDYHRETKEQNGKAEETVSIFSLNEINLLDEENIIPLINKELVSKLKNDNNNKFRGLKCIGGFKKLEDSFAIFGADNSFIFADQKEVYIEDGIKFYNLFESLTAARLGDYNYTAPFRPWGKGQTFKINGIESVAITASKFIPLNMIYRGRIATSDLKKVRIAIQEYLIEHPEFIASLFSANQFEKKH